MFQHFAGEDEVVLAELVGWRVCDVEARLAIVEGIAVVEFLGEGVGKLRGIAHAEAAQALDSREVRQFQAEAE